MKAVANYILFFLIIGYFFNSDYFERNFFLNEFFSLLGFGFFLVSLVSIKHLKLRINSFGFWILLFSIICVIHLIVSIPYKTNWYYYARTSVIFYSVFSYFLGYYFFNSFDTFFVRLERFFKYYIATALFFFKSLLARYSGPVLFIGAFSRINYGTMLFLSILIIIHGFMYDALSIIVLAPMLIVIIILPNYKSFRLVTVLVAVSITFFIIYFEDNFLLYKTGEYRYFGNVKEVYESHPLLSIDDNTIWRLILWYRYTVERFPENILGIGFGTPLLPYVPDVQTSHHDLDEVHAHVSGAHNSFITLFLRLGLAGLVVILTICKKVFQDFYDIKSQKHLRHYLKYYLIWFTIFTLGLFNLSLESPLRASIFWISLGFLSKINVLNKYKSN